jgi:hypothetical protein
MFRTTVYMYSRWQAMVMLPVAKANFIAKIVYKRWETTIK